MTAQRKWTLLGGVRSIRFASQLFHHTLVKPGSMRATEQRLSGSQLLAGVTTCKVECPTSHVRWCRVSMFECVNGSHWNHHYDNLQ